MQLELQPFSHVGFDYFGPLLVRQRRSDTKRYSCLFTCLTTRAVCLELAVDLSTDALLNAIRRFVSRYIETTHFYTDNGTNLVDAERVLREQIKAWNQSQIYNYFCKKEIQWSFNPPAASHMGRIWERMIRSVRHALLSLTEERRMTEDLLNFLIRGGSNSELSPADTNHSRDG